MKIAIGSDHAGYELKEHLRTVLEQSGHCVEDYGTHSTASTDYPDYAALVGRAVAHGQADYGILVCMTGVGMSIAANKIHGVRAALGTNPEEVAYTRRHNNANVLTFGQRYTTPAEADQMLRVFLGTGFEGGDRHERRVNKITTLEREG
jgi:ribose 5-phosphate isomerase B